MINKEYDFLVFIGRFQPFHKGHAKIVDYALQKSNKVIFLLGSSNKTRTKKNPFTTQERIEIIKRSFPYNENCFLYRPLDDFENDEDWLRSVKKEILIAVETIGGDYNNSKIGFIGMDKDNSTYYLDYFKNMDYVEYPKQENPISATEIREWIFDNKNININDYLYYNSYEYILQNLRNIKNIT